MTVYLNDDKIEEILSRNVDEVRDLCAFVTEPSSEHVSPPAFDNAIAIKLNGILGSLKTLLILLRKEIKEQP